MKRTQNKNYKKGHQSFSEAATSHHHGANQYDNPKHTRRAPFVKLEPKSENQSLLMHAIRSKNLIFATGPAGTGKTYIAVAMAAEMLASKQIDKIILSRPAVEAEGEKLGFLPGEMDEKYAPYIVPVAQIFKERLTSGAYDMAIKSGQIEPVPLGFMRGRTFDNAVVILDEAQNTTPGQMKMLLTRVGHNCKVIVCGDLDQSDIQGESGLADAARKTKNMRQADTVQFDMDDCVRSDFAKAILYSYSNGAGRMPEQEQQNPALLSRPVWGSSESM